MPHVARRLASGGDGEQLGGTSLVLVRQRGLLEHVLTEGRLWCTALAEGHVRRLLGHILVRRRVTRMRRGVLAEKDLLRRFLGHVLAEERLGVVAEPRARLQVSPQLGQRLGPLEKVPLSYHLPWLPVLVRPIRVRSREMLIPIRAQITGRRLRTSVAAEIGLAPRFAAITKLHLHVVRLALRGLVEGEVLVAVPRPPLVPTISPGLGGRQLVPARAAAVERAGRGARSRRGVAPEHGVFRQPQP
mmetsp:Transcript_47412/g.126922  ORF Transcript_47412/g.126922 Transcript_47412/m.126922 type:complete len:245 (+) Transcript_47412:247-981(+)